MSQENGRDAVALILRDVARLVGRVRLVPSGSGLSPALAHADLWRMMPRLIRRIADAADAGRVSLAECGGDADTLRETADLIELYPCPVDAK